MAQENRELLLKDLCARLPYNPIVSVAYNYSDKGIVWELDVLRIKLLLEIEEEESWEYIKPYLRPMSSMTDEEKREYYETMDKYTHRLYPNSADFSEHTEYSWTAETFDWLNKYHFDYRGLIPKGLAIEVNKSNNPYV